MATRAEQAKVFLQDKPLDKEDEVFMMTPINVMDKGANEFSMSKPEDPSAGVFKSGPALHKSAKDFIEGMS